MAICSKCGVELASGARFCKACGSGQEAAPLHGEKKARVLAGEGKKRGRMPLVAGLSAVVLIGGVLAATAYSKRASGPFTMESRRDAAPPAGAYIAVKAQGGVITIPGTALQHGKAAYFSYAGGGKEIKFFVLKADDGSVRAALDACAACYHAKLGYRQEGDAMVCNNCGMAFRSADIGKVSGGCNPIPLNRKAEGQDVLVRAEDLEAGARYF